jgi:preprotein translocase subunit SecA
MALNIFRKMFGSRNDRQLKRMSRVVTRINELEGSVTALSDDELRARTDEFRKRLADGQALNASFRRAADWRHGAA